MAWSRESRHTRGYGTEWDKLRRSILDAEPACRPCRKAGRATLATQVDHIISKANGGTDDRENLQPICTPCHDAKTARDAGKTVRPTIGEDGWPV